jgi:hypothetical protein
LGAWFLTRHKARPDANRAISTILITSLLSMVTPGAVVWLMIAIKSPYLDASRTPSREGAITASPATHRGARDHSPMPIGRTGGEADATRPARIVF